MSIYVDEIFERWVGRKAHFVESSVRKLHAKSQGFPSHWNFVGLALVEDGKITWHFLHAQSHITALMFSWTSRHRCCKFFHRTWFAGIVCLNRPEPRLSQATLDELNDDSDTRLVWKLRKQKTQEPRKTNKHLQKQKTKQSNVLETSLKIVFF